MGVIHLEQKNPTAAEDSFRKAVRARVDYGDALYQLGRLYQQQGREEEAITELKLAVESRSLGAGSRPEAHFRLTQLLAKKGQYDEAWKHARIAKRLGSTDVDPLLGELARLSPEPASAPQ